MAARRWFGISVMALFALGCSGEKATPTADTAGGAGGMASNKPDPLPEPLETMISAGTFMAFAEAQPPSKTDTTTGTLPGDGSAGCTAQVPILVIADEKTSKIVRKKDFSTANGYVMARLWNNTNCATTVIPIPANSSVYWVARMDPTTKIFDSWIVGAAGGVLTGLGFNDCPTEHASNEDIAELRTAATVCLKMGSSGGAAPPIKNPDWSLWIACSEGCCYTDRTGFLIKRSAAAPPKTKGTDQESES